MRKSAILLSALLLTIVGVNVALAKPVLVDNCPVPWTNVKDNNHIDKIYGPKGAANDYCHCFIDQAVSQCKQFHGQYSPFCLPGLVKTGVHSFSPESLCHQQLDGAYRGDPNYSMYLNNCISDMVYYKKAGC